MPNESRSRDILVLALVFGLIAGLIEGVGLLVLQKLHWLNWPMGQWPVGIEIVWVSPAFAVLLFGVIGSGCAGLRCLLNKKWPFIRWAFFLFAWMTLFDWAALSGKIRVWVACVLAVGLAATVTRWFSKREQIFVLRAPRYLLWLALVTVSAFLGIEGAGWSKEWIATRQLAEVNSASPNILVIVLDTVRADHLSVYGYPRSTSPNLERLANQGVIFENAFSGSSWTLPSHASLLTGRYPHEHLAQSPRFVLDQRFPTIAEALRDLGFRTGGFSGNPFFVTRNSGLARGFIHFEDFFHSLVDMASRTLYGRKINLYLLPLFKYDQIPGRKSAAEVNQEALRWIDRHPRKQFFILLNYFDAHDPYLPPPSYRKMFWPSWRPGAAMPGGRINTILPHPASTLSPIQLQSEQAAYDGALRYLDDQVGGMLDALDRRGLSKTTFVVVTSDHGEAFEEHGILGHGTSLYPEEIHVPLLFSWPGHLPEGTRVSQPVTNISLPATIVDLLAARDKFPFPGQSLAQLWISPSIRHDWPEPIIELEQRHFDVFKKLRSYHGDLRSLITDRWQYINTRNYGDELYDWIQDPREKNDLAATVEGIRIKADLARRLEQLVGGTGGTQHQAPRRSIGVTSTATAIPLVQRSPEKLASRNAKIKVNAGSCFPVIAGSPRTPPAAGASDLQTLR